jgi:exodeoxyribonuclease VII small subunit
MADKTYKELQTELDTLMMKLQDDELDVDTAITTYEQASKIITQLQKHLKTAENKLNKVKP